MNIVFYITSAVKTFTPIEPVELKEMERDAQHWYRASMLRYKNKVKFNKRKRKGKKGTAHLPYYEFNTTDKAMKLLSKWWVKLGLFTLWCIHVLDNPYKRIYENRKKTEGK